jgi:hypothetical protein
MNFSKQSVLNSASRTIKYMKKKHCIDQLLETGKQIQTYHNSIMASIESYPINALNESMLYRTLTGSFKRLKNRRNLITESYMKTYCKVFTKYLEIENT